MNGEKAAYGSPTFSNRRQRTLDSLITRLLQDHIHEVCTRVDHAGQESVCDSDWLRQRALAANPGGSESLRDESSGMMIHIQESLVNFRQQISKNRQILQPWAIYSRRRAWFPSSE